MTAAFVLELFFISDLLCLFVPSQSGMDTAVMQIVAYTVLGGDE